MAEHIAIPHDHSVPDWCDDPERSLKFYWMPVPAFGKGLSGHCLPGRSRSLPGHGVMVGEYELGEREGHRDYGALFGG